MTSAKMLSQLSKQLSQTLRHAAVEQGIPIRSDGFVLLSDVLSHNLYSKYTMENIESVVSSSDKKRFQIEEIDGNKHIRAVQGHTMDSVSEEGLLTPILSADEVPVCVHGTYRNVIETIKQHGLNRMSRNHIHMAVDVPTGDVISGARQNVEVLIFVDVEKAMSAGILFFRSVNNVILSPGPIPSDYFNEVRDIRNTGGKADKSKAIENDGMLLNSCNLDDGSGQRVKDERVKIYGNIPMSWQVLHDELYIAISYASMIGFPNPAPKPVKYRSAQVSSPPCGGFILFTSDHSKVVLVRNHAGALSFPKGKRESGEDVLAASYRELYEETGLMADDVCLLEGDCQFVDEPSRRGDMPSAIRLFIGYLKDEEKALTPIDVGELSEAVLLEVSVALNLLMPKRVEVLENAIELAGCRR